MSILLLNGIIYYFYGYYLFKTFGDITPFSFMLLIYMIPLLINIIFSIVYLNNNIFKMGEFISPVFSVVFYLLFGISLQKHGLWQSFADKYTLEAGEISISVATNMVTISQIGFVILLYFGINRLLTLLFIKKGEQDEYIRNY